jgi:hypothetical protein
MVFDLAWVGFAQTDDMNLARTRREYQGVQPAFNETEHPKPGLTIVSSLVGLYEG